MITKQDIETQKERIQNDLMRLLDGLDDDILDDVCQIVADRMDILLGQFENND